MRLPYIDDEASGLFEQPNETGSPERRLLVAILERAILDYVGNDAQELAEAEEWIFRDSDSAPYRPFTFKWLCHELDLECESIKAKIKAMPKRGTNRVAPWYFMRTESQSIAS